MLAASVRVDLFQSIQSGSADAYTSCMLHSYVIPLPSLVVESADFCYSKKDCKDSESGLIYSSGVSDTNIWDKGTAWASFECHFSNPA